MARALLFAAIVCALGMGPLAAQEGEVRCNPQRPVQDCYERYRPTGGVPAVVATGADSLAREAAQVLQAKPTGTTLSKEGPLTAIRDFLPPAAAALLAPVTGEGPSTLGFKLNLPMNDGVLFDWPVTAQLAAVTHEAEPFAKLIDSIPVSRRTAARERIEAGLEPYDDVSLTGSLNVENRSFGRGMRQHRGAIDSLLTGLLETEAVTRFDRVNQDARQFRQRVDALVLGGGTGVLDPARARAPECVLRGPGGPKDSGEMRFDCFAPAVQDSIEASISRVAAETTRELRRTEDLVRSYGVLRLAQLLNNQPQINGSWEYRTRRDVVGPNEWTGTARFELGFANLNGLRRHCGAEGIRPSCLRTYTESPAVRSSLSRGDRVWAQLDFARRSTWSIALPDDSVALALGAATRFAVSGGYGAYLGGPADGEDRDRLDVQAKLDFAREDPVRQDRLVASVLYTRRLSDQSSALVGLTYANRPEFLGDVDRNLRANLGLTYKVDRSPASMAGQGAAQ